MTFQQLRRELALRRDRASSRSRSREREHGHQQVAPQRQQHGGSTSSTTRYIGRGRYREVDNETGVITVSERARDDSRPRGRHEIQRRQEGSLDDDFHRAARAPRGRQAALRAIAQILRYVDEDEE